MQPKLPNRFGCIFLPNDIFMRSAFCETHGRGTARCRKKHTNEYGAALVSFPNRFAVPSPVISGASSSDTHTFDTAPSSCSNNVSIVFFLYKRKLIAALASFALVRSTRSSALSVRLLRVTMRYAPSNSSSTHLCSFLRIATFAPFSAVKAMRAISAEPLQTNLPFPVMTGISRLYRPSKVLTK